MREKVTSNVRIGTGFWMQDEYGDDDEQLSPSYSLPIGVSRWLDKKPHFGVSEPLLADRRSVIIIYLLT